MADDFVKYMNFGIELLECILFSEQQYNHLIICISGRNFSMTYLTYKNLSLFKATNDSHPVFIGSIMLDKINCFITDDDQAIRAAFKSKLTEKRNDEKKQLNQVYFRLNKIKIKGALGNSYIDNDKRTKWILQGFFWFLLGPFWFFLVLLRTILKFCSMFLEHLKEPTSSLSMTQGIRNVTTSIVNSSIEEI
ncbi:hypothetical protein BpHYR1_028159 [Brachionus plicatilis]|uniref:Uncharacterized protein n=1 Tax=Brachionus plicatilis TaxID=10195 RepID=A0A3M7QD47_BRAPC|nr:hypothetical protein BpHYR1_028159 [Brachionus plicatilis]